jgi:hypothetical protein
LIKVLDVTMTVPWSTFEIGMSFFIPCVNTAEVAQQVRWDAARFRYEVVCKQVIEKGKYGLRCWRVG